MTVALTPSPGRESPPFHGSRDVSLPFGLYNFPRRTLGKRGSTSREEGKEDNWLSFHWRFRLFPPIRLALSQAGDWHSPGGIWEAASSDSSLPPVCAPCLLPDWEVRAASTKPDLIPLPLPFANARRKIEQKEWEQREKWVLGYP